MFRDSVDARVDFPRNAESILFGGGFGIPIFLSRSFFQVLKILDVLEVLITYDGGFIGGGLATVEWLDPSFTSGILGFSVYLRNQTSGGRYASATGGTYTGRVFWPSTLEGDSLFEKRNMVDVTQRALHRRQSHWVRTQIKMVCLSRFYVLDKLPIVRSNDCS